MLTLIVAIGVALLTGKLAFAIGYVKGLRDDLEMNRRMKNSYYYQHFVLGRSDEEILNKD
nr:MAG TPA: hypothetical protein [Caudoviricetes sp.]